MIMKKAVLFITIFSLAFLSCNDLSFKKKEVRIEKKGRQIFLNEKGDTVVFNYRDDGTILSKFTIKNKYKNGLAFNYYDDGTVQHELNYKDGVKHGVAKYFYESGKLYRETFYVNGQIDGLRKIYYENGKLQAEIPYVLGQLTDGTVEYTNRGILITSYPTIDVKRIKTADKNNIYLQFSVDPPKSVIRYYLFVTFKGGSGKIELDQYTNNGVVTYPLPGPSSSLQKMQIKAEIKTRKGHPMILSKDINLYSLRGD
jgi:hypothetical protein